MALTDLLEKDLQFILFGGKGGVGKTTMAASSAVTFARHNPKKRILIFTTDPAPSLADSFEQRMSSDPVQVEGFTNLWALEISAKKELEKFKKQYGSDILDILQEGTYLSAEENEEIFSLDIPGLDEVMGLKKITDFMDATEGEGQRSEVKSQMFDTYILDTAPTGHTLRLLTLPELLDDWIKFLARLRWKYHAMVRQLSRGREERVESADEFLLEMKRTVKKVQALLRDPDKTTFVAVTIPEAMGVEETKDLIANLKLSAIPIQHVIINNIVPDFTNGVAKESEGVKFLQKRRSLQSRYVSSIKKSFPDLTVTEIELEADEVKGAERLLSLGKKLFPTQTPA
jgi:arsenite/tail-anchored protein-transporting ATPase